MTNEDKLKKVIERAEANGYCLDGLIEMALEDVDWNETHPTYPSILPNILFDHSFARAFWGEQNISRGLGAKWQFHLQQAVISESPLDYYFNNL